MGALKLETYTYDDYKQWEGRWELIYGYPVPLDNGRYTINMAPAPYFQHQKLGSNFLIEIGKQIDDCPHCEVVYECDWIIEDEITVCPDVILTCNHDINDDYIINRPEIIVEISSKSTAKKDETTKLELYEEQKVPYYILAYSKYKKLKIYKFNKKENNYESLGSFTDEKFTFKDIKCKDITIDIKNIFKRIK